MEYRTAKFGLIKVGNVDSNDQVSISSFSIWTHRFAFPLIPNGIFWLTPMHLLMQGSFDRAPSRNTVYLQIFFWIFFIVDVFSPFSALRPVLGRPVQALGVDVQFPLLFVLDAVLDGLVVEHQHVLALVVVDEVEMLQRRHHVLLLDARHFANLAVRYT